LLRYSQNASDLRAEFGQLRYFNPTADEFRSVFRATDAVDQQIQLLTGDDPATVQQRNQLLVQRDNAIKAALGTKRYQEYALLQDPLYREALATATQAGTPESARALYAINLAAAGEQDRINTDTNLTASQRSLELKRLELEQLRANTVATGQDLPPEPVATPATPAAPTRRGYMVRPGDSIAVISMIYGVPASAIRQANPNVNFSRLRPGVILNIPPPLTGAPVPTP
jgi:LysM repeat protein